MRNVRTKTIFYLDLKSMHVHKYGSAKFDPNLIFSSQQMATESVAKEKKATKKKKVGKPIGDPVGGRDAPMRNLIDLLIHRHPTGVE